MLGSARVILETTLPEFSLAAVRMDALEFGLVLEGEARRTLLFKIFHLQLMIPREMAFCQ